MTPARAAVRVLGKAARVVGGEFSTDVALEEGANVIDISAGRNPTVREGASASPKGLKARWRVCWA